MALRYYLLRGSPVSGAAVGITVYRYPWTTGGTPSLFLTSTDKADETANGYANTSCGVGSPGPIDATDSTVTFIYELPTNLVLAGTLDCCLAVSTFGEHVKNLVVHAYVTEGTTGGLRGTLLNGYIEPAGTNEVPAGAAMGMAAPQAITPVNAIAGDYIVVELGFIFRGPFPNNSNVSTYHGCKSSGGTIHPDLTPGLTGDFVSGFGAGWIEFALVPTPIPQPDACPPCGGEQPGTGPDPVGPLPPWTALCTGGGDVEAVADLADGEDWAA
jgi:hypothetical protein